ncbi:permease-like cell division protein FtsX [Salinibacillus xinjiangensis]|uniref:Cell division protein FtsX n=1 Tax=Salinibacillus xinjiangensis TaxID=1229268 RepID=A0A6G1X194_9BACI|nr:permease-like cell division protein FtsX [Salinibacillus xinjiangensis]MRG84761.1 FtsX-like permease family protein [Salinibacillus xinjiangensis]
MKLRTIKRHLREGSKNILRNGWMTFASVGSVTTTLILVGVFLVLMLNLNQIAENVEEDVQIKVLIEMGTEQKEIDQLENKIKSIQDVSFLQFSSKENELERLMASMGDDGEMWKMVNQDNPLNDVFVVKTEDPLDTMDVASRIKSFDYVDSVDYGDEVIQKLFTFNEYSRYVGLALIAALVLTAAFLISNTIKITIMARRKEIGIMKLVGATNGFIRWPFFIEGLLMGILGAILPIIIVVTGYYYLYENMKDRPLIPFIELLPFNPFVWQVSLILLGIGAFIGIWGSVMSVRKFLKV